jgi:hypothetical protein
LDLLSIGAKPGRNSKTTAPAAASGSRKAGNVAMPPPLSGNGSAPANPKRARASKGPGDSLQAKAEKDLEALLQKCNVVVHDFEHSEKGSLLNEKDKAEFHAPHIVPRSLPHLAYPCPSCIRTFAALAFIRRPCIEFESTCFPSEAFFKNANRMTRSLAEKVDHVGFDSMRSVNEMQKKLGIVIDMVKAYKAWGKKGSDEEFLQEIERMKTFARDPSMPVEVSLPPCIQQDSLEVKFICASLARRPPLRCKRVVLHCAQAGPSQCKVPE